MDAGFFKRKPHHEIHGYGKLNVGETLKIDLEGRRPAMIRNRVHSYGDYHQKKFLTRVKDGHLYVHRSE